MPILIGLARLNTRATEYFSELLVRHIAIDYFAQPAVMVSEGFKSFFSIATQSIREYM